MKFLCLPGAYGSAKNFEVQLKPFAQHMEERGLASFTFTQGEHEVDPPIGWEHYFGVPPFYRFLDSRDGDVFEALRRVRQLPRGLTSEETLRLFENKDKAVPAEFVQAFRAALDRIHRVIEKDGEIDAILGYSEGAMLAASVLYEENIRCIKHNIPRRIKVTNSLHPATNLFPIIVNSAKLKEHNEWLTNSIGLQFGIFFSGTPPLGDGPDGLEPKLADKYTSVIDVPTFHVFGSNDPLKYSAVALYNVCNQDTAMMWDHGLGHLVPRDAETVTELGDILQGVIEGINKSSTAGTDTPNTDYTDPNTDYTDFSDSEHSGK